LEPLQFDEAPWPPDHPVWSTHPGRLGILAVDSLRDKLRFQKLIAE
jgi:hypothetical protein